MHSVTVNCFCKLLSDKSLEEYSVAMRHTANLFSSLFHINNEESIIKKAKSKHRTAHTEEGDELP